MTTINRLLQELEDPTPVAPTTGAVKTASAKSSGLDTAIDAALAQLTPEKTAAVAPSQGSPLGDLTKLAQETIARDAEGDIKLAHRMGSAFTDGMMERLDLYNQSSKTASDSLNQEQVATMEKFASENPEQFNALVKEGYDQEMTQMQKTAEAVYQENFEKTSQLIHTAAAEHFVEGWTKTAAILSEV
jgi:hypothetical protein